MRMIHQKRKHRDRVRISIKRKVEKKAECMKHTAARRVVTRQIKLGLANDREKTI